MTFFLFASRYSLQSNSFFRFCIREVKERQRKEKADTADKAKKPAGKSKAAAAPKPAKGFVKVPKARRTVKGVAAKSR